MFSIGHRATLRPFHARLLVAQINGNGLTSIVELPVDAGPASGAVKHDKEPAKPG